MFAFGKTNGAVGLLPAIVGGVVAVGLLLSAQSGAGTTVPELPAGPAGPAVSVTLDLVTRVEHPRPGEVTIVLAAASWDPPRARAPQKTPKAEATIRLATAIETVETGEPAELELAPLPRRKPMAQDPAPPKTARAKKPAPRIALIIDDMGVDVRRSAQAAALPGPLTLSYLPYASSLVRQAKAARPPVTS